MSTGKVGGSKIFLMRGGEWALEAGLLYGGMILARCGEGPKRNHRRAHEHIPYATVHVQVFRGILCFLSRRGRSPYSSIPLIKLVIFLAPSAVRGRVANW